jgi:hypothetical protein
MNGLTLYARRVVVPARGRERCLVPDGSGDLEKLGRVHENVEFIHGWARMPEIEMVK